MLRPPFRSVFALTLLTGACTTSSGAGSGTDGSAGACEELIESCHLKDDGQAGPVNDCHGVGHAGVEADCVEQRENCIAICDAAPTATTGSGSTGGTTDGTSGGSGGSTTDASTGNATDGTGGGGSGGSTTSTTSGSTGGSTGSGSTGGGAAPVCDWMAETCQSLDTGCADLGGAGNEAACISSLSECLPKCGTDVCTWLGSFCHDTNVACHDIGHDANVPDCEASLEECAAMCG